MRHRLLPDLRRPLRGVPGSVFLLLVLAGCASDRGIPEFAVYETAFESSAVTVDAVLDELEAVERARSLELIRAGSSPLEPTRDAGQRIEDNGGFDDVFHSVDSVYYVAGETPPATAGFRRAMDAIAAFNAVAKAYSEGRALDEVGAELVELGSAIDSLQQALAGATQVLSVPLPGAALVSGGVELVKAALEAGSREAFRNAVVELQPKIDRTLAEMQNAAPIIFELLTGRARNAARDAHSLGETAKRDAAIAELEAYRVVLSNWVVSLDDVRRSLAAVVAAIEAPATPASLLRDLTLTTRNAEAVALQTRQLIGEIRARR